MADAALALESTPSNGSDEDGDENFEDARQTVPVSEHMDLTTSIDETTVALSLFFNNRFADARERMAPWADRSMYHALGYGTLMYLQAALTFDMADIEAAVKAVKRSVQVCNQQRKKTGVIQTLTGTNYQELTEEQCHAELCYAECLIERALLTFVQDENLISFVKGSLKIRACYNSYKQCLKILQNKEWNDPQMKINFESGVRLGIGIFNLMISLLPTKILRLLEFVGFSGNKEFGLAELQAGAEQDKGLRWALCTNALLAYHTVMTYILGTADGDIELSEKLLLPCLKKYPKGALFLFFAGRLEEIKGNLDEAIVRFEECIEVQSEWRQFHHLCYWELMWCSSFKGDWLLAMKFAERLCRESRWSKATYTYQKAAFLLMCDHQTDDTQAHVEYLFGEVPKLKQRIAGKSIPIEKFAVKKAKRYFEQGKRLTLPAMELIYVWNGFMIIGKKPELIEPILAFVEETINDIMSHKGETRSETEDIKYPFFYDDYCLALVLKGVCLKHRGMDFQAEQCFREVWQNEKNLRHDTYLVPYALMELALIFIQTNSLDEAKNILDKAKKFSGYSLESRLHFRVKATETVLRSLRKPEVASTDM